MVAVLLASGALMAATSAVSAAGFFFSLRGLGGIGSKTGSVLVTDTTGVTTQTVDTNATVSRAHYGKTAIVAGWGLGAGFDFANGLNLSAVFDMSWSHTSNFLSGSKTSGEDTSNAKLTLSTKRPVYDAYAKIGYLVNPHTLMYVGLGARWQTLKVFVDALAGQPNRITYIDQQTTATGFLPIMGMDHRLNKCVSFGFQLKFPLMSKKTFHSTIAQPAGLTNANGYKSSVSTKLRGMEGLITLQYNFHV